MQHNDRVTIMGRGKLDNEDEKWTEADEKLLQELKEKCAKYEEKEEPSKAARSKDHPFSKIEEMLEGLRKFAGRVDKCDHDHDEQPNLPFFVNPESFSFGEVHFDWHSEREAFRTWLRRDGQQIPICLKEEGHIIMCHEIAMLRKDVNLIKRKLGFPDDPL